MKRIYIFGVIGLILVIGITGLLILNLSNRGKAFEYLGIKQQVNPSPHTPQAVPPNNNQTPLDVLPVRGKFGHLNKTQQRLIQEWGTTVYRMALQNPNEIVLNGSTKKKAVALTFDDGPDGTVTPQVLNILQTNGIKATFCYVGTQIQYFPQIVQQTAAQGNLILNHTFDHPNLANLQSSDIKNEVSQDDKLIFSLTGYDPLGVRPPYGFISQAVVHELHIEGKIVILWSLDSLDWAGDDANTVVSNVLDNVRPGDIILMHSLSNKTNTVQALPTIINGLRAKGYDIVRVDQLIKKNLQTD